MPTIAVLVPPIQSTAPPPRNLPIVQAIMALDPRLDVIFGHEIIQKNNSVWINGLSIKDSLWIESSSQIDIIHDRFPSQIRKEHFNRLHSLTSHIPWGNPLQTTLLCRDKFNSQILLENSGIQMPEVTEDPDTFIQKIEEWGLGFIKPRYGALGVGVEQVTPNTISIPKFLPSVVPNQKDPTILQRAISPPRGTTGMCVRQLIQKTLNGLWIPRTAVLRTSDTSAVVNVARGAKTIPAKDALPIDVIDSIQQQSIDVCSILDKLPHGALNVEFGLDFVLDQNYKPWLIEVNSRPRGRLEHLAKQYPDKYLTEHQESCIQPLITLAGKIV